MSFPTYAKILADGYSVKDSDIVERTPMDRGLPKQRKTQSDVLRTVSMRLLFEKKDDAISFEDWYYDTAAAGAAYFDWVDPVDGVTHQARVVANTLGAIQPLSGGLVYFTRTLQIEYLRPLT